MTTEGVKLKLAAILSADIEGYSRTLTTYREAISILVQQYKGRLVDAVTVQWRSSGSWPNVTPRYLSRNA